MDLRELAASEASAFIDRLVAAAEARAHAARVEAEQQVAAIREELDALRSKLDEESARAGLLEVDLDAVIDAHRQVDSERIAAEQARTQEAAARSRVEDELRGVRDLLHRTRAEASRLSEALEDEAVQKAILADEFEGARKALAGLETSYNAAETKVATLEGKSAELEQLTASLRAQVAEAAERTLAVEAETAAAAKAMRDRYDGEIRAAHAAADAIGGERDAARAEAAALRAEVETIRALVESVRAEAARLQADAEANRSTANSLQSERDGLRVAAENLKSEKDALRLEIQALQADAVALRADADAFRADAAALRQNTSGSSEQVRSLQEMLDASRQHHERQVAMAHELESRLRDAEARLQGSEATTSSTLASAIRAIDALGGATTISQLFATLVSQLATELPRVALFRVKGSHLEGEYSAGVDDSVVMEKIVVPMNMDSLITRAAHGGGLVRADGDELTSSRPPFGGSPVSAIAIPVTFQGEPLAVLYADSEKPTTNAHATFALLIVRHATVLLSRLTAELKVLKELREYAMLLLQEAEQMFVADVDSGRPAHESIRRLRDTIDCGRQLYAQRAALEGAGAAGLFDEQVSVVINAQASAFAEALAAATASPQARKTAS